MKRAIIIVGAYFLAGCASVGGLGLPQTLGERSANYGYVPLDPLPIETVGNAGSCKGVRLFGSIDENGFLPLTQALPDVAVRFAVAEYRQGVGLQFGPTAITAKNQNYRAILDYVNSDSVTVRMLVRKYARINGVPTYLSLAEPISSGDEIIAFEAAIIPGQFDYIYPDGSFQLSGISSSLSDPAKIAAVSGSNSDDAEGWQQVAFPVYVGVGFRLTADFQALKGDVSLGGLGAIGANADAERLTGSMTLQSIGVNGLGTTTALALPNKLDQTTIEQSILAIGTGRALIYTDREESKVRLSPRVIGLYSPVGSDPRLINAVYSELSTIRLPWARPCDS